MFPSILIYILVPILHGFLLENNNTLNSFGQTGGNQQYITKSELYDTQIQLQNGIDYLRHDTDKKFVLLASQLQQMLASLKQQTENSSHTIILTKKTEELERKYSELMVNYTKLQEKFESLQIKYTTQEIELQLVKNKTMEHGEEIVNLNSLKSINQLTDIHTLQKEVQSISKQTHSLAVNENARTQDFQALYNLTVTSDRSMQNDIHTINVSLFDVREQIAKNSERVALTACAESSEYGPQPNGHIIKYNDIRTHVNVNNLSSFRISGKFTCEKEGLYLVSAWDLSNISGSEFSIYKNGNLIANAYISEDINNHLHFTATAVVAVELLPNDTVWVQVRSQMKVYNDQRSCFTTVKVQ